MLRWCGESGPQGPSLPDGSASVTCQQIRFNSPICFPDASAFSFSGSHGRSICSHADDGVLLSTLRTFRSLPLVVPLTVDETNRGSNDTPNECSDSMTNWTLWRRPKISVIKPWVPEQAGRRHVVEGE